MKLDREEFVVTFDARKMSADDLITIIRDAGYTSYIVSDDAAAAEPATSDEGSLNDPLFTEALDRAMREDKPLVLDFMASWCLPCQRMEMETFADPDVAKLLEQVVFVKVDTDDHPDLAEHFGVAGLPDIRFLIRDGTEVRRLTDFQDAKLFTEFLIKLISLDEQRQNTTGRHKITQPLHDLSRDAHEFQQAFNNAKGTVRVVMLVSPG